MIKIINSIERRMVIVGLTVILSAITAMGQQALPRVYDEQANPLEQIDNAVVKARSEAKNVVCQVGGNWCPWCLRFAAFITSDEDIKQLIDSNYVYIHVNYNPAEASQQGEELMRRLNNPRRFGFPVLVVLNGDGKVIHTQDSALLEEGNGYSRDRVLRFFTNWTPAAVNAPFKQ